MTTVVEAGHLAVMAGPLAVATGPLAAAVGPPAWIFMVCHHRSSGPHPPIHDGSNKSLIYMKLDWA
jgi:hypothetical protein